MQSVVYIYTRTGTTPIYQLFDPIGLSINRKISEVSTAEFDITVFDDNGEISDILTDPTYIAEKNRIKIGLIHEGVETIEFDGYITNLSDSPLSTHVICSDALYILGERMVLVDTTVSGNIWTIVGTIMTTINSTEDTGIAVATSSLTNTIPSKVYPAFTYVIDILKDLADQWNGTPIFFVVKDGILYFDSSIGSDISSLVSFIYEYNDAHFRTIEIFTFDSDVRNIVNSTYTKNSGWSIFNSIDTPSKTAYGRIEKGISLGNGDPQTEVNNSTAKTKNLTRNLAITPTTQSFSLANIGDIVTVYIDGWDLRRQYDGTMRVTGKEYISGDLEQVKYSLSNSQIQSQTILDKMKDMDASIERLKNGTMP